MKHYYLSLLMILTIQQVLFSQITNDWTSSNISISNDVTYMPFFNLASVNYVTEYRFTRRTATSFEVMEGGYSLTPEYTYNFGINESGFINNSYFDFTGDDFPEFYSYLEFPDGREGKRLIDLTTGSVIAEFSYTGFSVPSWSFSIVDVDNDDELEIVLRRDEHPGQTYYQWITYNTGISVNSVTPQIADIQEFELLQNYPNPFNPITTISYTLESASDVTLKIYDVSGQLIREFFETHNSAGTYKVIWNGSDNIGKKVSSGTYFYSMESGDYKTAKKMILLK